MQHTAAHCMQLQHTTTLCNTLHTLYRTLAQPECRQRKQESCQCREIRESIHCNILHNTTLRCITPQHTAIMHRTRVHVAVDCRVLQCVAAKIVPECSQNALNKNEGLASTRRSEYQHTAHATAQCNTLQHTATHCNTLQHSATHWNTRRTRVQPKCPRLE